MIHPDMDTRRYKRAKRKMTPAEQKASRERERIRQEKDWEYRNSREYLYPEGACHCDRCVQDRYWAGDTR